MSTSLPTVKPDPDVIDTAIGEGETALLHLATKTYFSLNVTGTRIWQLLKQGHGLDDVARRLHQEFEVEIADAERSVQRLVGELVHHKLAMTTPTSA